MPVICPALVNWWLVIPSDPVSSVIYPGNYTDENQQSLCKVCLAGTKSEFEQQSTKCLNCSAGSRSSAGSSTCTLCGSGMCCNRFVCSPSLASTITNVSPLAGTFSPTPGSATCTTCSAGTQSRLESGSDGCDNCTTGQSECLSSYCVRYEHFVWSIIHVVPGRYSNSTTGFGSCVSCPDGSAPNALSGATGCVTCSAGKSALSGNATCSSCSSGSFIKCHRFSFWFLTVCAL